MFDNRQPIRLYNVAVKSGKPYMKIIKQRIGVKNLDFKFNILLFSNDE